MPRIITFLLAVMLFAPHALYADETAVARVNGVVLTQKELDAEVDKLIPQITFHRSVPPEKRKQYFGRALEEMINRELQYQDAVAKGIQADGKKVEENLSRIKKRFKSETELKSALEKDGLNEDRLKEMIQKEVLVQAAVAKMVTEPSKTSEKELTEYYEKNKEKFKQPESAKVRLITTKDEKKARDIASMVKAGDDFGELAYGLSEDAYRAKSGDIGYVHRGRMLPEIDAAAFKLKNGEVSEPVLADNNWYIIKVEDKKPEQQMSFDKVKNKIKKDMEKERQAELSKKWMDEIRAKAKIEVLLKTE